MTSAPRNDPHRAKDRPAEVTGRMVLACLLAFFAVIAAMNFVLIKVAVSTFSGLETESSYRAGLAYGREILAAQAQQARHWQVTARIIPVAGGETTLELLAQDASGRPLTGFAAAVRFAHPMDRRLDRTIELYEDKPGRYRGVGAVAPGGWDLIIELMRAGERHYLSKSRISLR